MMNRCGVQIMAMVTLHCECAQCRCIAHLQRVRIINIMLYIFYHNEKLFFFFNLKAAPTPSPCSLGPGLSHCRSLIQDLSKGSFWPGISLSTSAWHQRSSTGLVAAPQASPAPALPGVPSPLLSPVQGSRLWNIESFLAARCRLHPCPPCCPRLSGRSFCLLSSTLKVHLRAPSIF